MSSPNNHLLAAALLIGACAPALAQAAITSQTTAGTVDLYSSRSHRLGSYQDLPSCESAARAAAQQAQASLKYTCRTSWTVSVTYSADDPPSPPSPSPAAGSAHLSWQAPTTNTDGSALTDLAGFYIYRGNSTASLQRYVEIDGANTASFDDQNLAAGTWVYTVSAFNKSGVESAQSVPGSKTIQ